MELVPNGSLRGLLQRRAKTSWPLTLGLDLMRQAAEGLAAAHAQNVIHRDIKPDNMLLLRTSAANTQPESYQLKISDFGLARLAEGNGLTATGAAMGTLAYMAPEQALGTKTDSRTDLYSLGVVLYEVATGYLPFQIDSFEDALRKHTQAQPLPPSQVRPDLPVALDAIILRCLAKKPEDRYQTGTELARDLQGILGNTALETVGNYATPLVSTPPRSNNTALRSPSFGDTPAPVVATLQGYSAQPRVRVLDQSGQTLQVVELTRQGQGIIIGRQEGNAVVLPSNDISRQHALVQWDGSQITIKDLGSSNGTRLEETRLQPNVSYPWPDRQIVHLGPFWLRLEGIASNADVLVANLRAFRHTTHPPI